MLTYLQSSHPDAHPNIVCLFNLHKTHNHSYLVLKLYRGGDLHTFIQNTGPLNERLMLRWSEELLNVVVYLQERHVANLDIKPQNIMLTEPLSIFCIGSNQSHIVLCDFGFSRVFKDGEKDTRRCVTPSFMAPEVAVSVHFCDS